MPAQNALIGPIFALATWTGFILLLMAYRRLTASRRERWHPNEFALGESPKISAPVILANRNYMNLLELPVLFYVVCILALHVRPGSSVLVGLGWAYVIARVVHSVVHVTYNNVVHRFWAFVVSNAILIAMWVALGLSVASSSSVTAF